MNQQRISALSLSGNSSNDLVWAIISVAVTDYLKGDNAQRIDAARYFQGKVYQKHLRLLGLPASWLPNGIQRDFVAFSNHPRQPIMIEDQAWG